MRQPPPAPPAALTRALAALAAHHDALRLRFRREEGRWRQRRLGPPPEAPPASPASLGVTGRQEMARIDLSALAEERVRTAVTAAAAAAQRSLDLAAGPLLRALWLDLPAGEARLFLAVHHLAVDGVSWRILLDDLATAWRQIGRGEPARLPPRTASFRRWAERLAEQARTMAAEPAEPEIAFWLAQTAPVPAALLAPPLAGAEDTVATAASVAVELGEEDTADLLRALPAAHGASIADALVAALAAALTGPGGAVCIDLEGHGREEVGGDRGGDLDLSRSVGWFTSLYPVRLAPGDDPRPEAALAAVRRQLAAVPGRGLGYGLLRYLSEHPAAAALRDRPPSPVSINYLGQLDAALPADSPFAAAGEPVGPSQSPRAGRSHALAVVAWVAGGRLEVTWTYGAHRLAGEAVRRLAERLLARLRELAASARSRVLTLAPIPAHGSRPFTGGRRGRLSALSAAGGAPLSQPVCAGLGSVRRAAPRHVRGGPRPRGLPRGMAADRRRHAGPPHLLPRRRPAAALPGGPPAGRGRDRRGGLAPARGARAAAPLRGAGARRPPAAASTWRGHRSCAGPWCARASAPGASSGAITTPSSTAGPTRRSSATSPPATRRSPPAASRRSARGRPTATSSPGCRCRDPAADDDFFGAYLAGFGVGSTAPTPLAADRPAPALDTAPDPAIAELRLSAAETAALRPPSAPAGSP